MSFVQRLSGEKESVSQILLPYLEAAMESYRN